MLYCEYCLNEMSMLVRLYGETKYTKLCKECEPLQMARSARDNDIAELEKYIREYDLINN